MTARTWIAVLSLLLAAGLGALNLAGLTGQVSEHPRATSPAAHKNGISGLSYAESQRKLAAIDTRQVDAQTLAEINTVFAARLRHYWPAPGDADVSVMFGYSENWVMALRQRLEAVTAEAGLASIDVARIERREFQPILQKGVGLCSTATMAIADFLRGHNIEAKVLALHGHVVALATVSGAMFVLDPDYNVVFPVPDAKPAGWGDIVRRAYASAGYTDARLDRVAEIYSKSPAQGGVEPREYTRSWRKALQLADIAKWLVPVLFAALGIGLLLTRHRITRR